MKQGGTGIASRTHINHLSNSVEKADLSALESNLLAVSSKEGEGMDDLYSIVQSTFAGGDDLEAHTDSN